MKTKFCKNLICLIQWINKLRNIFSIGFLFLFISGGIYAQTTLFSYQSGDWNVASTWTTDPSGTLFVNPLSMLPTNARNVVVLNGRTVTIPALLNNQASLSMEIKEGGILSLGLTTGHNFGAVTGMGTIQMEAQPTTFGAGTSFTTFIAAGGGTFELKNTASFTIPAALNTCNNLIINTAVGVTVTFAPAPVVAMTIKGNLTIAQGTFQINSATGASQTITINGGVLVESPGYIRVGTGNFLHNIYIKGDLTNYGDVKFSNLAAPNYTAVPANGYVYTIFNNAITDQSINCYNSTEFYRIQINKGVDKTYILNIDASNNTCFKLFGRNNYQNYGDTPPFANHNALDLEVGTCRLGPNIVLPCLARNTFFVDPAALLWLDGAQVTSTDGAGVDEGFYMYGGLKITANGILNVVTNTQRGIVMRDDASIEIEDGLLSARLIRTSAISGTNRGAFTMRGNSTVTLSGNTSQGSFATFAFGYPANLIDISGGTINILNPTAAAGEGQYFSVHMGCDPKNINITGGTFNVNIPNGSNAYINSTVPFWDLNITSANIARNLQVLLFDNTSGTNVPPDLTPQPLVVLHNLSLQNNVVFNNTQNVNVSVGCDFSIANTATYTPGTNTTFFNGNGGQNFTNAGTITAGLNNLTLANTANVSITNNLTIRNTLTIGSGCFLNDVGHTITANGNILNNGTHSSQAGGSITLSAAAAQNIGGSGSGVFGNLVQNNANGVTFSANQSIAGDLRLPVDAVFNIGTFNLFFYNSSHVYSAAAGNAANFTSARMITVAGNESDGGITKVYDASNLAFVFPFGVTGKYTSAKIQVNASPASYGSITSRPVNKKNTFASSNNVLSYYWKTRGNGFSGIAANSIRQVYKYVQSDVVPVGGDNNYVAGVYVSTGWNSLAPDLSTVDEINDSIKFPTTVSSGMGFIDGEFTAGESNAFNIVNTFYSRQNGNWNDNNTWSTAGIGGAACPPGAVPGINIPGPSNPVVIGDGAGINHTITVPAGFMNISTGSLQINSGSVLDLTSTTGHNFGSIPDAKVTGNGKLRISSAAGAAATAEFPRGDFGLFLNSNGGTVEYYSDATYGATTLTIPAIKADAVPIVGYKNLTLSPQTGRNIVMPNSNLTVYGDFTISGVTITGIAQLPVSNTTSYTLTINGNLNVNTGNLRFMHTPNIAQNIVVLGNVTINSGAAWDIANTASTGVNSLTIYGDLTNNGTFNMFLSATRICNLTFMGSANNSIKGTTAINTNLNAITINKGTNRNSILDVTVNTPFALNTALANALTLTNGTFRLTTNTAINLSTAAFTIPTTGCISSNGGTFNIATALNNASDLYLNGRLEVLGGTITIGTPGNNFNNDIEYASAGTPEIIVGGGTLNVNGQIRRSTTISTGSLKYTQSGGTVNIYGRNGQNVRPLFEILNEGSLFRMSNGTIIILNNFNNNPYTGIDDFYLMPDTSDVTGGTVQFGNLNTTANSHFNVISSAPLWNITIDGNTNAKIVDLHISPITVQYDLTISGVGLQNSVLNTNGLDVTIGHNLYNYNTNAGTALNVGGFQAFANTQTTALNGSANQLITGRAGNITNFANLIIDNAGSGIISSLAANTNIRVNSDLNLNKGTLDDGGNTITVIGNIVNSATHTSPVVTGGIVTAGTQKQFISGNGLGTFGNIAINNANGVDMLDNATINGRITFTSGLFYIDDMLLTLGINSSIAGAPSSTSMIRLNGALSDLGVKKLYPTGASPFTFPIGVTGKYTPATLNVITNAYAGTSSIIVKPINAKHPATFETPPVTNELQYYWNVTSSGFNSGVTIDHIYQYLLADALPDETGYVVGRYQGLNWSQPAGSSVNNVLHRILINGSNNIDGEYTCGINTNFQNLATLYSCAATAGLPAGAVWDDPAAWTLVSDGSGGPAPYAPNGNPVVILPGHMIYTISNGNKSYSILLNGTLDLRATINHSHGHVSGNGTLIIGSTLAGYFVFPGGEYDAFMNTSGTTVDYYSTISATLPNAIGTVYKPYQNLRFTGSGTKYMASVHMKVLGNLDIQAGYLNNSLANKNIYLIGNWNDAVNNGLVAGKGMVSFDGTAKQSTTIKTNETFYNLKINNALGDSIVGSGTNAVQVSKYLYLTTGNIITDANHMLHITNNSTSAVVGGGSSSFVNGPMRKTIVSGSFFNFPTGRNTRYGNVYVSNMSASGILEAEYFTTNPHNVSSKVPPIDTVTTKEHWRINFPAASTGNVRIRWDALSDIIPLTPIGRTKLRIVEWNGSAWQNRGDVVSGTLTSGTIRTNPAVNLNGDHDFTIGLESLPTANITSGNASICNDGIDATTILVDLTGTAPWTLKYKINGANEQTINNIGFSPASIVVNSSSPGISGTGVYQYNISYISDVTGSTGMRDFIKKVAITVEESPTPSITGKNPVSQNEASVNYSITGGSGRTYNWVVTGGSISAGQGTTQITVTWGAGSSGTVQVTETITSTGCAVTATNNITINPAPSPVIVGNSSVCSGATESYSTGAAPSHRFTWAVNGGTIVGGVSSGMGLNSIQVIWGLGATGSVQVLEEILAPYGAGTNTLDITINPLPDNTLTVTDPVICSGSTAAIIVEDGEGSMDYTLRLNSDNSVVDFVHTAAPGDVTLSASPIVNTVYNVLATNEYSCSRVLTDLATVTIQAALAVGNITGETSSAQCNGYNPIAMTISPTGGSGTYSYRWQSSIDNGTTWNTIGGATAATYDPGAIAVTTWYRAQVDPTGSPDCDTWTTSGNAIILDITPTVGTPVFTLGSTSTRCQEAGTITYTATATNNTGITYSLDAASLSGGNSIIAGTGAVTYVAGWSGTSIITATATGCNGPATATHTVTTDKPITSIITGDETPSCMAAGVTYSVVLTPGSEYSWSAPTDATITSGETGPDNYQILVDFGVQNGNISVTETNSSGCTGSPVQLAITLQGCNPIAGFSASDTVICLGEVIVFTDESQGVYSGTSYQWDFGTGAIPATAAGSGPHTVNYTTAGLKSVQLIVSNGISDTLERVNYIAVNAIPVASVESADRCGTGPVDFLATITDGDQVEFSADGGMSVIDTVNSPPFVYVTNLNESSELTIWARALNTVTGCSGTWDSSAYARAFEIPFAEDIRSANHTGSFPTGYVDVECYGDTNALYYVVGDPLATYNWRIPELDITINDTSAFEIDWTFPGGDYTLELVKISPEGCAGLMRDTLVLVSQPDPDLGGNISICGGDSYTFDLTGQFENYLWPDNTFNSIFTTSVSGEVFVKVWDEYGCSASDTAMVAFYINPVVVLGRDTVICGDNSLILDAGDFAAYDWSTGENNNPITVHEGAGVISVTVTDENGCQASDEIVIRECTPETLLGIIPNTFTPNHDNVHDSWVIKNIFLFPDADIQVFDRWGRLVFRSDGGYNNDWYGTGPNSNELPVDTYYYIIDLKVDGFEPIAGTVTIIR